MLVSHVDKLIVVQLTITIPHKFDRSISEVLFFSLSEITSMSCVCYLFHIKCLVHVPFLALSWPKTADIAKTASRQPVPFMARKMLA